MTLGRKVKIAALTCELPRTRVGNNDPIFERLGDVPKRWWRFWGINQRGYFQASEGETELSAAETASLRLMNRIKLNPEDIDLIICSSSCPILADDGGLLQTAKTRLYPRLSRVLKERLGLQRALGFDVQVECGGFLLNLNIAASYIRAGLAQQALVVCSEQPSRMLDFTSLASTMFADGCAVALLTPANVDEDDDLLAASQYSNADYYEIATGQWRHEEKDTARKGPIRMYFTLREGGQSEMQSFVPETVPRVVKQAVKRAALTCQEVDYFVFHQPSPFLVQCWANEIGCSEEKYAISTADTGVMVSVAVPYTLYKALNEGSVTPGKVIVLAGAATGWGFLAQVWRVGQILVC
ncbi:MAG: 3-oxoacyl-ACP synthase III family protein [Nitrospira sp.]|nr:3-oxoacyl-ACP synthase III family protein [Nitrospira sp.]